MNGDPQGTYVVWIADLDKTPLVDTRGNPIPGRVLDVREASKAAIVTTDEELRACE